jgi:hypothetical protein
MKWAMWLLLAAPWAWAESQIQDRAAIDKVVSALNDPKNDPRAKSDKAEVWSETSRPLIVIRSIQFVSSKIARVDAERVEYGSVAIRRSVPVVILLEKKRAGWKITSSRDGDSASASPPIRIEGPPR